MSKLVLPFVEIDDKTDQELAQQILSNFMSNPNNPITEFGPGSISAQLCAGLALLASEIRYTANRTVKALKNAYYTHHGLERKYSTFSWCILSFTLFNVLDHDYTIYAGTKVQTHSTPPIRYSTTVDITIPSGKTEGSVIARAEFAGTGYSVKENELTIITSPIPYVESVTNTVSEGGVNAETEDESITRMQGYIATHKTATTPESYESLAVECYEVYRAKCYPTTDYYNPTIKSPSTSTLMIQTIGFANYDGVTASVIEYLEDKKAVGWPLIVRGFTPIDVNVEVDIRLSTGTLASETENIRNALEVAFLDWDFQKAVTPLDIKNLVLAIPSIVSCRLQTPEESIIIGKFGLPKLNELQVNLWQ